MKRSIEWHKDCLAKNRRYLQSMQDELVFAQKILRSTIATLESDINALDAQIFEAELLGVTEFDSDKFGIKKATPIKEVL